VSGGTVLVTGASTGIGRATVSRLAANGRRVWAGVRDPEDVAELGALGFPELEPIELGLTRGDSIAASLERIAADGGLDAVVNNAGVGVAGPLELLTDDELREQLEVNVVGQLAVARAALPLLRRSDRPRLVFVGSVGGRLAFPFAGAYTASKHAIEALADALRIELGEEGIPVSLVEPPSISTPIWDKARARIAELRGRPGADIYAARLDAFDGVLAGQNEQGGDPDEVAEVIERALDSSSPRARYPHALVAQVATRVRPLIPDRLFDALAGRRLRS
jgi:NAD(P)-dependent dehydrogenase (short-subunit alcohol dehydrogenase family)